MEAAEKEMQQKSHDLRKTPKKIIQKDWRQQMMN